ncbi:MAG: cyclic nucleotide-binding domain-containing protein [Betaproteobacteria bacterium]|nr:MAG: cyclic nucleotide-binding domain-containing protein [Betaproteobacteria bacterium]
MSRAAAPPKKTATRERRKTPKRGLAPDAPTRATGAGVPNEAAEAGAASLSLKKLAALLKIGLDGANIEPGVSFTLRRVQQGMALYRTGDPFGSIYAIRSGTFKNVLLDANGNCQVLGFPMTSDVLGLDGLEAQQYRTEAVALEDSEVAIIPFPRLGNLGGKNGALQQFAYRLLSRQLAREHTQMWLLGSLGAESRVAAFLLILGERYARLGYSDTSFNLRMTRLDLGSFLGLTQETVSRALSGFSETGVIRVKNKELQILDAEKLHQIVARSRHSI